ncbi:MAG: RrF2 family transcriptional regulator [Gemmataceae bacterium]
MALLSRKADYALLILSHLHHCPNGSCSRRIAERFGLKSAFTAKILKLLCKRGFVRSQRGIHGGYVLAQPAGQIVLLDLLEKLGEPFHLADCRTSPSQPGCGLQVLCPVQGAIQEVDRRIREVLTQVTLGDLVSSPGSKLGAISPLPLVEV